MLLMKSLSGFHSRFTNLAVAKPIVDRPESTLNTTKNISEDSFLERRIAKTYLKRRSDYNAHSGFEDFVPHRCSKRRMNDCALAIACLAISCTSPRPQGTPSIEFTHLPPAGDGSSGILLAIAGKVINAHPGQKVVLFAHSGVWWVQPLADQPFTPIQRDFTWKTSTHPGWEYAALLVDANYHPSATVNALPPKGGGVAAVVTAAGAAFDQSSLKELDFGGYHWEVRQTPGSPAGTLNLYDARNAWVDRDGFLHLRILKTQDRWTSAQVGLTRSLGYGSYRFVLRDVSGLEPSVVLTISSGEGLGRNREMDIEISRWGESTGKNTQYVVQPYYVPANVVRFLSPSGRLTYSFDWSPDRVAFRTARGADTVASHVFTSGVPPPGAETIRLNLYNFDDRRHPLKNGAEVIIEKFEYLP